MTEDKSTSNIVALNIIMWYYKDKEFTQDDLGDNQKDCPWYSFVYIITNNLSKRKYIGKKVFWSKRTLPPLKGTTKKRIVIKPSDWLTYYGSCKPLLKDIEKLGKDSFSREIIGLYPDKREANYAELRYQILLDVLDSVDENGDRIWYNENIDRIYYPSKQYGALRHKEYNDLLIKISQ